jgi:hypothetical protein
MNAFVHKYKKKSAKLPLIDFVKTETQAIMKLLSVKSCFVGFQHPFAGKLMINNGCWV